MPLLDISPLEKSVAALGRAADALAETPQSHPHYEHLRAAVVLNFQIVLEMSRLFMRRCALARDRKMEAPRDARDMLRVAEEEGLIDDPKRWMAHRKLRNIVSHAYNEEKADKVAEDAAGLLADAKEFVVRLRAKTGEAE